MNGKAFLLEWKRNAFSFNFSVIIHKKRYTRDIGRRGAELWSCM
ncbi:hypothetical protein HMPREF0083_04227 [Aneurinibacillus aneurinilyticus ATCC 12856]|uniref:Uncharacterized protein n=1 Tax=Aneurinibacillus aneurinilyticus ATCC 12856 TaxID=649747 RepID=U1Y6A6_ANEAE|nr:hypothetical protein HMPREF0083_04227 [Aneurinibacillus aneurinilyticus ATCC 12856]